MPGSSFARQSAPLRLLTCCTNSYPIVLQTIYLPVPGLVDIDELKPGDLVGANKDSYLILEKLVRSLLGAREGGCNWLERPLAGSRASESPGHVLSIYSFCSPLNTTPA